MTILYCFIVDTNKPEKFEELALGERNTVVLASVNDIQIHCQDLDDISKCLEGYKQQEWSKQDVVLWFGNSQIHSINHMKEGDETAVPDLYKRLGQHEKYLLTFSQPNANLQEHYLLTQYLLEEFPVKTMILPVVFDDMRNVGIRSSLVDLMKKKSVVTHFNKTAIGQRLLKDFGSQDAAGNEALAKDITIQEKTEDWLNIHLGSVWPKWEQRPEMRGKLFLYLYNYRNKIFGITSSSIRKIIPGRYNLNKQALLETLELARIHEITVLLYIAPLRSNVKIPYDIEEYRMFKDDMKDIAYAKGVYFVNLEDLVPAEFWDNKSIAGDSDKKVELDFMHFKAGGHKLLAKALYKEIVEIWNSGGNP